MRKGTLSSGTESLYFCHTLHPRLCCVVARSEHSGETARMRRLVWALAVRICDKYQNILTWFWSLPYDTKQGRTLWDSTDFDILLGPTLFTYIASKGAGNRFKMILWRKTDRMRMLKDTKQKKKVEKTITKQTHNRCTYIIENPKILIGCWRKNGTCRYLVN